MTAADIADFGDLLRLAARVARGDAAVWGHFVAGLPAPVRRRIAEEFFCWQAHGGQREPPAAAGAGLAPWRVWLLMAGRGFGKTRAGAEWVSARAREMPGAEIALVGASRAEVAKVMVEGPSGLLAVARSGEAPVWVPTRGVLRFASGATAFVYSAAAPEGLRGPEHHFAWCDELAKWPVAKGSGRSRADMAWDNLVMGLRKGDRPRAIVTTTPRATALLRRVRALDGTVETGGRSGENVHLAQAVRQWLVETYGGTRLGRQELDGVLFGEPQGALWTRSLIEACRVPAILPGTGRDVQVALSPGQGFGSRGDPNLPIATRSGVVEGAHQGSQGPLHHAAHVLERDRVPRTRSWIAGGDPKLQHSPRPGEDFRRIVVGVDPPVSADGDACGIVVCALGADEILYVLADCSVAGLRPEGWARAVARAAAAWGADRVIAEKNQGGDMVESVLRSVDAMLPVRLVSASRGKAARAEPVAARFESGRAKLAGRFPELEDEMAGLTLGGGYEGPGASPDRCDAMVWAMTELMRPHGRPRVRGFQRA
jgi:phage terminase large subunit-like protein